MFSGSRMVKMIKMVLFTAISLFSVPLAYSYLSKKIPDDLADEKVRLEKMLWYAFAAGCGFLLHTFVLYLLVALTGRMMFANLWFVMLFVGNILVGLAISNFKEDELSKLLSDKEFRKSLAFHNLRTDMILGLQIGFIWPVMTSLTAMQMVLNMKRIISAGEEEKREKYGPHDTAKNHFLCYAVGLLTGAMIFSFISTLLPTIFWLCLIVFVGWGLILPVFVGPIWSILTEKEKN